MPVPALKPGACVATHPPSTGRLPSTVSAADVTRHCSRLHRYYAAVRLLIRVHAHRSAVACMGGPECWPDTDEISQVPTKGRHHVHMGSPTARGSSSPSHLSGRMLLSGHRCVPAWLARPYAVKDLHLLSSRQLAWRTLVRVDGLVPSEGERKHNAQALEEPFVLFLPHCCSRRSVARSSGFCSSGTSSLLRPMMSSSGTVEETCWTGLAARSRCARAGRSPHPRHHAPGSTFTIRSSSSGFSIRGIARRPLRYSKRCYQTTTTKKKAVGLVAF